MEGLKNFDIEETTFDIVHEVAIKTAKDFDNSVFGEIRKIAKENGIEKEVVLNETAILNALEKQIPKKLRVDDEGWLCCPNCDETFKLHDQFRKRNKYCGKCGQALDWSDIK